MDTYDDFQTDQASGLETLGKRIERDLEERHFCVVFEDEVERCWPKEKLDQVEREGQIPSFCQISRVERLYSQFRGSYQGNIPELVKGQRAH